MYSLWPNTLKDHSHVTLVSLSMEFDCLTFGFVPDVRVIGSELLYSLVALYFGEARDIVNFEMLHRPMATQSIQRISYCH